MPHLLAYKNNNNRHLVRWNNSPSSAAKHLGAGYITYTMSKDTYKNFIWGQYYHEGIVDKACGFWSTSTRAGEEAVADALYNAVKSGNSTWPYQGNEWNTQNWGQPCYWYFCGGMCISGVKSPELASESAMGVTAYHFTLPEQYRGLSVVDAKIVWKGLGSFVQNMVRPTSQPMFYAKKTWEDNNSCWGNNYKLQADFYQDTQTVAVHIIHGSALSKSNFNPAKCFFVYDNTNAHTAYEFLNLLTSCADRKGEGHPTREELLAWFNIDMDDAQNSHWKYWGWHGSRSTGVSSADRFSDHTWAIQHGGTETTQPLFPAGSGWGFPYISGAQNYPADGSVLRPSLDLTDADKAALASADGVWVIVHGLPELSRKSLSGGSYLPTSQFDWECAPWRGKSNTSAVGRYIGTEIESLDTFQLQVTIG